MSARDDAKAALSDIQHRAIMAERHAGRLRKTWWLANYDAKVLRREYWKQKARLAEMKS